MLAVTVQQSTLGVWESILVSVIGGLAVVFIPFIFKYFNKKFQSISDTALLAASTAAKVERHHKSNKRAIAKIDKGQLFIIEKLNEMGPDGK